MKLCFSIKEDDLTNLLTDISNVIDVNVNVNIVSRALIETEIENDHEFFGFLEQIDIIDKDKLIDLVSKFFTVPDTDNRVEELQGGGSLIKYDKKYFKYDVFALMMCFVSLIMLYISYLKFYEFVKILTDAQKEAITAHENMDTNVALILKYFVSLIPGCSDGNFQMKVITKITELITTNVYKTTSLSLMRAQERCFTSISSDPYLQFIASSIEYVYDRSNRNACVNTVVSNDLINMVRQFTEDVNISFGKADSAFNLMLSSSALLVPSIYYLRARLTNKPAPFAIENMQGGGFKMKRVNKTQNKKSKVNTIKRTKRNKSMKKQKNKK